MAIAFSASSDSKDFDSPEFTAIRIAERVVAKDFPDFDTIRNPPKVEDKASYWEISYRLPRDMQGGTPVFDVDKKTFKVIAKYHSQ